VTDYGDVIRVMEAMVKTQIKKDKTNNIIIVNHVPGQVSGIPYHYLNNASLPVSQFKIGSGSSAIVDVHVNPMYPPNSDSASASMSYVLLLPEGRLESAYALAPWGEKNWKAYAPKMTVASRLMVGGSLEWAGGGRDKTNAGIVMSSIAEMRWKVSGPDSNTEYPFAFVARAPDTGGYATLFLAGASYTTSDGWTTNQFKYHYIGASADGGWLSLGGASLFHHSRASWIFGANGLDKANMSIRMNKYYLQSWTATQLFRYDWGNNDSITGKPPVIKLIAENAINVEASPFDDSTASAYLRGLRRIQTHGASTDVLKFGVTVGATPESSAEGKLWWHKTGSSGATHRLIAYAGSENGWQRVAWYSDIGGPSASGTFEQASIGHLYVRGDTSGATIRHIDATWILVNDSATIPSLWVSSGASLVGATIDNVIIDGNKVDSRSGQTLSIYSGGNQRIVLPSTGKIEFYDDINFVSNRAYNISNLEVDSSATIAGASITLGKDMDANTKTISNAGQITVDNLTLNNSKLSSNTTTYLDGTSGIALQYNGSTKLVTVSGGIQANSEFDMNSNRLCNVTTFMTSGDATIGGDLLVSGAFSPTHITGAAASLTGATIDNVFIDGNKIDSRSGNTLSIYQGGNQRIVLPSTGGIEFYDPLNMVSNRIYNVSNLNSTNATVSHFKVSTSATFAGATIDNIHLDSNQIDTLANYSLNLMAVGDVKLTLSNSGVEAGATLNMLNHDLTNVGTMDVSNITVSGGTASLSGATIDNILLDGNLIDTRSGQSLSIYGANVQRIVLPSTGGIEFYDDVNFVSNRVYNISNLEVDTSATILGASITLGKNMNANSKNISGAAQITVDNLTLDNSKLSSNITTYIDGTDGVALQYGSSTKLSVTSGGVSMGGDLAMGAHNITLGAGQTVDGVDIDSHVANSSAHHVKTSIEDSPVDGHTTTGISSNWAYDHTASSSAHHTKTTSRSEITDFAHGSTHYESASDSIITDTPVSGGNTGISSAWAYDHENNAGDPHSAAGYIKTCDRAGYSGTTSAVGTTSSNGTSTDYAHGDHTHNCAHYTGYSSTPEDVTTGSGDPGTAGIEPARGDHVHHDPYGSYEGKELLFEHISNINKIIGTLLLGVTDIDVL